MENKKQKEEFFIEILVDGDFEHFIEFMDWNSALKRKKTIQAELFLALEGKEKELYDLVLQREPVGIDDLIMQSEQKPSEVSALLFSLEMRGLVSSRPGKLYAAVYR